MYHSGILCVEGILICLGCIAKALGNQVYLGHISKKEGFKQLGAAELDEFACSSGWAAALDKVVCSNKLRQNGSKPHKYS